MSNKQTLGPAHQLPSDGSANPVFNPDATAAVNPHVQFPVAETQVRDAETSSGGAEGNRTVNFTSN